MEWQDTVWIIHTKHHYTHCVLGVLPDDASVKEILGDDYDADWNFTRMSVWVDDQGTRDCKAGVPHVEQSDVYNQGYAFQYEHEQKQTALTIRGRE